MCDAFKNSEIYRPIYLSFTKSERLCKLVLEDNIKVDLTETEYVFMDFSFKLSIIRSNEGILLT